MFLYFLRRHELGAHGTVETCTGDEHREQDEEDPDVVSRVKGTQPNTSFRKTHHVTVLVCAACPGLLDSIICKPFFSFQLCKVIMYLATHSSGNTLHVTDWF